MQGQLKGESVQSLRSNVLLLTATVQPMEGLPDLARTDPSVRLQDYKSTLHAYLSLLRTGLVTHIVFAENSGADLTSLKTMVAEAGVAQFVEFVSFYGLDFEPAKGRGFGEFKLVDYAMSTALCLRDSADVVVWKCTGRYFVRNLGTLIRKTSASFDLQCHCRDYPMHWCELYLLAWSRRGYEGLIRGVYPKLANRLISGKTVNAEAHFRTLVDQQTASLVISPRFKVVPLVDGIRGYDNVHYADRWYSPKLLLRRSFAYLLPSIWI